LVWRRETDAGGWRAWVPWPHIAAEQLMLGNPDWAKGDTFVRLQRAELRLSPLPLLWKTVRIPRIDVVGPQASLQRLADGRNNWTFDLGGETPDSTEQPWVLDIGTIGFDQGQISLEDAISHTQLELQLEPLGQPIAF